MLAFHTQLGNVAVYVHEGVEIPDVPLEELRLPEVTVLVRTVFGKPRALHLSQVPAGLEKTAKFKEAVEALLASRNPWLLRFGIDPVRFPQQRPRVAGDLGGKLLALGPDLLTEWARFLVDFDAHDIPDFAYACSQMKPYPVDPSTTMTTREWRQTRLAWLLNDADYEEEDGVSLHELMIRSTDTALLYNATSLRFQPRRRVLRWVNKYEANALGRLCTLRSGSLLEDGESELLNKCQQYFEHDMVTAVCIFALMGIEMKAELRERFMGRTWDSLDRSTLELSFVKAADFVEERRPRETPAKKLVF